MLKKFLASRSGATAIEYGLIAMLIAVAAIGGITTVGESTVVQLEGIADQFPN